MNKRKILIAKIGLDGHDRGAKIVASFLKDSGHEVIYSGLHNSAHHIVGIALQEDVEIVGLSILSGAHKNIVADFMQLLKSITNNEIRVFLGGLIPEPDIPYLKDLGVDYVFSKESKLNDILLWLK
jgi:methylmalonyl-CoA mutase C-terminal domain/subunit